MIGKVIRGEEEAKLWYEGPMFLKDAAEFLGISQYKLRKLTKENKVPYTKMDENSRLLFHEKILNAWKNGEFQNGRVKLILFEETIDYNHEEALIEHYERYPELKVELVEEYRSEKLKKTSNINYDIIDGEVHITVGDKSTVEMTVCLSRNTIEEIYYDLVKS